MARRLVNRSSFQGSDFLTADYADLADQTGPIQQARAARFPLYASGPNSLAASGGLVCIRETPIPEKVGAASSDQSSVSLLERGKRGQAVRCSEQQTRAGPLCRQASRTSNGLTPWIGIPVDRHPSPLLALRLPTSTAVLFSRSQGARGFRTPTTHTGKCVESPGPWSAALPRHCSYPGG